MTRSVFLSSLVLVALTLVLGCKSEAPTDPAPIPEVAKVEPPPAPKKADPSCVGPVADGTPETIKIGDVEWELRGSTLTRKTPMKANVLSVGAITDIKENTEENKANLTKIVAWLKKKKVDLVVVTGDSGENQSQIEDTLAVVATVGVPVFAVIGNREGKADFRQAMLALRAKHGNVLNMNAIRRVDTPVADLISMPGYYDARYIHTEDGCPYFKSDLEDLKKLAASTDSPTVLVSHGPPRQDGVEGIDRTAEGANVGDPGLSQVIASAKIPFGIFGNVHEAGGRATDFSGKTVIKPGEKAAPLYLNPGPADGVRWGMNDGTESVGMAGLLTIHGDKADYEIFRVSGDDKVARTK